jgi:hypothetical protein
VLLGCGAAESVDPGPKAGDIATLKSLSDGDVLVAMTRESQESLRVSMLLDNDVAVDSLLAQQLITTTPSGTECEIVLPGSEVFEVRITEGALEGQTVFVSPDYVAVPAPAA